MIIRTIIVNLYCEFWNDKLDIFVFVGPSLDGRKYSLIVKFDKDLVVIGGISTNEEFTNKIYKLEYINGHFQWHLMNAKYKKERMLFVTAMIPSDFGNLY